MASPNPNSFASPLEKSAPPSGPFPSPENTSTLAARDAVRRLRRTRLARLVRSVVVASVVLCGAAGARAAIRVGTRTELEVGHASRVTMKDRALAASFLTIHDDMRPLPAPAPASKREPRRAHHTH